MKFYINEHDLEELQNLDYIEAEDYNEAREKLNKLIGMISEEDLKEVE